MKNSLNFARCFLAIVFLTLIALPAQSQSQFGRYIGSLNHNEIAQEQLAKLDFVVSKQSASELKLIGILTLYFGGFESGEYVTYHFNDVTYNILSGSVVFVQPDQDVTFVVNYFKNGEIKGRLHSNSRGDIGDLNLATQRSVHLTKPVIQKVWGEYRGECGGIEKVLQIQTSRTSEDSTRMGNPFGTFDLSAQVAEANFGLCENSRLCVSRVYDQGSYDFYSGNLELTGRSDNLSCKVDSSGLTCNSCRYERTSGESIDFVQEQFFPNHTEHSNTTTEAENGVFDDSTRPLSGNYRGYVFHEYLGVYQPVSLNLVVYQGISEINNAPALFVSAVSSMYFGDFNSSEFISHKFNTKEFPLMSPQITLERLDGDVDAIVQLTSIKDGIAKGVWNSLLFGRVGTFVLSNRDELPPLPENAKVMGKLGGFYTAEGWELDLKVIRESTPVNTVNPFFPLNLKGAFRFIDITPNIRISSGSYDFYTGKIGLHLENRSLFTGQRLDNETLGLVRPTSGIIRPMNRQEFKSFKKSK